MLGGVRGGSGQQFGVVAVRGPEGAEIAAPGIAAARSPGGAAPALG